jgi:hypothetical protein
MPAALWSAPSVSAMTRVAGHSYSFGPCRLPQQLGELLGAGPQLRAVRQEADASLVRLPAAHHGSPASPATAQVPVIQHPQCCTNACDGDADGAMGAASGTRDRPCLRWRRATALPAGSAASSAAFLR